MGEREGCLHCCCGSDDADDDIEVLHLDLRSKIIIYLNEDV